MAKQRLFISFDYDYDLDIKTMLAGQAKLPDSPFDFTDASVMEHLIGDWQEKVRRRMRSVDQVAVLCGEHTDRATGVNAELKIAQEIGKTYFLLAGRGGKSRKPAAARESDKLYTWEWENLKKLVGGAR